MALTWLKQHMKYTRSSSGHNTIKYTMNSWVLIDYIFCMVSVLVMLSSILLNIPTSHLYLMSLPEQEWVQYHQIYNEFLNSDWLYFLQHGISIGYEILCHILSKVSHNTPFHFFATLTGFQ